MDVRLKNALDHIACNGVRLYLSPADQNLVKAYLITLHKEGVELNASEIFPVLRKSDWTIPLIRKTAYWVTRLNDGHGLRFYDHAYIPTKDEILPIINEKK